MYTYDYNIYVYVPCVKNLYGRYLFDEKGEVKIEQTNISLVRLLYSSNGRYNVFSMIHGRSAEECRIVMDSLSKAVKIEKYDMLFSTIELKKSGMRYFLD
jgi:DNA-binding Lrp family transcriptional regulator